MIEFYFDFSSPFGYLASQKIEALAAKHGRTVTWRPMLLGAAFKATGGVPLTQIPLKGEYSKRDFYRSARFHGLEYRHPEPFPVSTVAAVDGEPFWGLDRFDQIDRWLKAPF